MVIGTGATSGGTPSATVNINAAVDFTNSTSYVCTVSGTSSTSSSDDRFTVQRVSGSSFTVRNTAARPFQYICVGN